MRTRSLSVNESRPLTVNEDRFFSTAILFKDSLVQPAVQPLFSFGESVEEQSATQDDILNFFKCYKCYDLIPTSAKLVVLDTQLVLKKAFFAMVDTGVRACPLWDSVKQEFVGMLTITDFIRILQQNYKGPLIEMETFEEQKLEDWKGITEHRE
jgi:5'-AMP-activated protein kinase regulatory gamma subunit